MRATTALLTVLAFLCFCGYALLHPLKARRIWQEVMAETPEYEGAAEQRQVPAE